MRRLLRARRGRLFSKAQLSSKARLFSKAQLFSKARLFPKAWRPGRFPGARSG